MNSTTYPPDAEEMEEIRYVHSLASLEIRAGEAHFAKKYPSGSPFVPQKSDLEFLDSIDADVRAKLLEWRERYGWGDYEIEGFTALVRIRLSMRFKRVEREISALHDWNLLVEEIIDAENAAPEISKGTWLRLIRGGMDDGPAIRE